MNKKKFIGLLVFIVFSCSKTGDNSPPDNLISPDQMSMVMLDIILMKNIKRESSYVFEKKDLLSNFLRLNTEQHSASPSAKDIVVEVVGIICNLSASL